MLPFAISSQVYVSYMDEYQYFSQIIFSQSPLFCMTQFQRLISDWSLLPIMLYVPAAGNNSSILFGKYFPISYDFIFNNK